MDTLSLILVFVMACYLSFKGGTKYGQYALYISLMSLPKKELQSWIDAFKDMHDKAISREEGE